MKTGFMNHNFGLFTRTYCEGAGYEQYVKVKQDIRGQVEIFHDYTDGVSDGFFSSLSESESEKYHGEHT